MLKGVKVNNKEKERISHEPETPKREIEIRMHKTKEETSNPNPI